MKKLFKIALTTLLIITLVACSQEKNVQNNQANEKTIESIVVAITKDENTLTPFTYITGTPGIDVMRLVYDSLYTRDLDNQVIPWMAKSCENDAEYRTFTIQLNEGLKWHDGETVTLEDVAFTFDYVQTQDMARWKKIGDQVESTVIEGDILTIQTKKPEPTFVEESLADLPIVPKHIYENMEDAKTFKESIGSGMYQLKEYVSGQKYVFEAVDNYFKGEVGVKTINMPIVADESTIYQGIQTGEYTTFTGTLAPEMVDTFEGKQDLRLVSGPGFSSNMLYMNIAEKPFDNVAFRQAISLAINNEEIVERVYLGKADLGKPGFFSPVSPFVNKDLQYTHDIQKAEQLLDEQGYQDKNEKGIRLDAEGKELSYTILTSTNTLRLRAAEVIAEQLKKVGIELTVQAYEADTLDSYVWPDYDVTQEANYQMSTFGWSASAQIKENYLLSLCSSNPEVGIFNLTNYQSDEFDQLEAEYLKTLEASKRREQIEQMQVVMAETIPFHTYAYRNEMTVFNEKQYDGFVMQSGGTILNVFSFLK